MSSRLRPGPLQELDLRYVPLPSTSGTPSSRSRPNKRPHSPSVGIMDSPAKRRLKAAEIIQTSKVKSPLSGSTNSARFAPAHFHALLQGPDSPAKRLDFASSETSEATVYEAPRSSGGGLGTPRRSPKRTTISRVRRSPRLSARSASPLPGSSGLAVNGQNGAEVHTAAIRASTTAPLIIPRVVTPPDRQSIHYPGFDIYQDPHLVLPTTSTMDLDDSAFDSPMSTEEDDKENVAPRRKCSKKMAYASTPSKETAWVKLLSPSASGKSSVQKPVPASPHPQHVRDLLTTPKARTSHLAVSPAATLIGLTPGRTPLGKEDRKQMRRAMEEEMDDVDVEIDFL